MNTWKFSALVSLLLMLFTSCSQIISPTETASSTSITSPISTRAVVLQSESSVDLLAGQSIIAGSVTITVEGNDLAVTYETIDGWLLYETHVWAGLTLTDMPQTNRGNPKLGLFPYNSGPLDGVTSYTVLIPLSTFGLDQSMTECADVSALLVTHAVVKKDLGDGSFQEETAYGEGSRIVQKGNWATWFSVVLTCESDEPPVIGNKETAFAFSSEFGTCFDGIFDTPRWGWSNGALPEGSYTFEIYAGAGQCDLSKGTLVGYLTITYFNGTATVTYKTISPYFMAETHLYIGNEPLPRNNGEYTVAPGQYPYINNFEGEYRTEDSYTVTGLSGDIHVVAHAVTLTIE